MNKEQRKRMAYREIVVLNEDELETTFRVQVSGNIAELIREIEHPWDNESGTGRDTSYDRWTMSLNDLKRLIESATWAIQKSEAFEQAHPPVVQGEGVTNEG